MRTVLLAVVCAVALATAGCVGTLTGGLRGSSAAGEVWDVVPGKSAGPIKLGMKSIEVHRALGVPTQSVSGMREIWTYQETLMVAFDSESKVVGVQLLRPGRVQWQGRWLDGSHTGREVTSVFGDPSFVSHWTKDDSDSVEYVIYGYRTLGLGVLADPRTDRIAGYIVAEPEPAPETGPEAPQGPQTPALGTPPAGPPAAPPPPPPPAP